MMRRNCLVLVGVIYFSVIVVYGCAPPEERLPTFYNQPLVTETAFMVIERGGLPMIMASGSLENKEEGLFSTAKHFTDELNAMGINRFKIFFNSKIYDAELARVSYLHDATLVRIVSPFSPENFMDPRPIATERPKIGQKVYLKGFHPHPFRIRQENEAEGFPDTVMDVLTDYYGVVMFDPRKETQIVFDNLEGEVIPYDPNPLVSNAKEYENEGFIKVRMARDHKFSFGGLSGGMVMDETGEVVGIITAQDIYRFEFDERGRFVDPDENVGVKVVTGQFFDTIYVTPMDSISDLYEYARK